MLPQSCYMLHIDTMLVCRGSKVALETVPMLVCLILPDLLMRNVGGYLSPLPFASNTAGVGTLRHELHVLLSQDFGWHCFRKRVSIWVCA